MHRIEMTKDERKVAIGKIQEYFENERDESIGDLQGELILDFIVEKIGPHIYNQAINDMHKYMSEKVDDMFGYMIY